MPRCTNYCFFKYMYLPFSEAHKLMHSISVELGGLSHTVA